MPRISPASRIDSAFKEALSSPLIESDAGGVVITVRVIPRASRSGLAGTRGNACLVRLTAPPVEGAANEELVAVLAAAHGVPRRAVAIVSGERSPQERVR